MLFRHKCTIKIKGVVLITMNEKKGYSSTFVASSTKCHKIQGD
jgi:hypothetical protein